MSMESRQRRRCGNVGSVIGPVAMKAAMMKSGTRDGDSIGRKGDIPVVWFRLELGDLVLAIATSRGVEGCDVGDDEMRRALSLQVVAAGSGSPTSHFTSSCFAPHAKLALFVISLAE